MAWVKELGEGRPPLETASDYQAWAVDLSSLLDAIEMALREEDYDRARQLVAGRFDIAEKHGLRVVPMGVQAGGVH